MRVTLTFNGLNRLFTVFKKNSSKWKETKEKNIVYINNKHKLDTRKFDIYELFYEYLNKNINYKEIEGIIGNIKRAVELYQKDRSECSDKNKSIINNSNKIIKV